MSKPTTICLVMMVRNEAPIIWDTLKAVSPYIDHWIIVDSHSTDNTVQLIEDFFDLMDIPGEVVMNDDWTKTGMKGGGQKRTEALAYAQGICDYRLLLDGDNIFEVDVVMTNTSLSMDGYTVTVRAAVQ